MRRLVVATLIVALALTLAACGGGGNAQQTPTAPEGGAAPVAPAPVVSTASTIKLSDEVTDTFVPFPTQVDTTTIPPELQQRIVVDKQPTLIYFYDPTQYTSKEVRKIIDAVLDDNRGLVDLAAFDIGKYVVTTTDPTITLKPEFLQDPIAQQTVRFAQTLGVTTTPFIVITDSQGYITYKHRGLEDRAFLEREVLRAAR